MEIKDIVTRLESSSEFEEWAKENKASYLVHVFKMMDELNKYIWQVGYYNRNNTITTFIIEKDDVKIVPEEKIFKPGKEKIKRLDVSKVKIDLEKALEIADKLQKTEYKGNDPLKIIVILQNIESKTLYNITYITQTFNTLNMRVDAGNKKILKKELTPSMQFRAK